MEEVFNVIDEIDNSKEIKRLKEITNIIRGDKRLLKILEEFDLAKDNYEKYGLKEEFISKKNKLFEEPILKEYLDIQNDINMVSIYINNMTKKIKDGTL